MSSDNVSLKVSLAANFKVVDPYRAINQTASYQDGLYAFLQSALREANTAKLLENNPALLQLRLLQALSSSSGNTIMLRLPDDSNDVLPPKRTGSQETDVAQRAE